jgi:O-antigen/teichoic acid export membrane protein
MTSAAPHLHLRRQAVWVVGCRTIGIVATVASNILAARLLGPGEFGTYLLATTVIALGSLLAMVGLNEAALRFISESLGLGRQGRAAAYARRALGTTAIASATASIVVTAGFAAFLLGTRPSLNLLALLALVALGIVVLAWQQIGAELLRAYGNLQMASFYSGGQTGGPVSNLVFLGGLVAAAALAASVTSTLALGIAVGSVCITCPLVYMSLMATGRLRQSTKPSEDEHLTHAQGRELLAVGGVLLLNQLLAFSAQQLDILIAGGMLSSIDLGLYGAAKRSLLIAAMPVQMATLTIVSSIPRLFAQSRLAELEKVVRGAATVAAVPSILALSLLVLFPGPILNFFLRDSYSQAGGMVIVLAAGYLVLTLSGNPQHVLTMTGRHRAVLAVNLLSAVVLVVVGVVGALLFGAAGLAAGSAASLILQNGVLWWLARRELGIWTHVEVIRSNQGPRDVAEQYSPPHRQILGSESVQSPEPAPSSLA